jgi:hypothetical protein
MTTKTIQARHLTTRWDIVRGGDGARRTTHHPCEIQKTGASVDVVIAGTWERVPFKPTEKIRVTLARDKNPIIATA